MNFCLLQCAPAEQLGFCFPVCKHIVLVRVSSLWLVFYSDPYPNDHNQIYLYIFPNILWDPNYPCLGTIAVYLFSFLFQQDVALQHLWALAWFSPGRMKKAMEVPIMKQITLAGPLSWDRDHLTFPLKFSLFSVQAYNISNWCGNKF